MNQNFRKQNATKSDYGLLYEICPQCGREVVLPCRACLLAEADALLSIHYENPDEQRRYEEVYAHNRRHGRPMFSSQPDDQMDDDVLTLVKGCWHLP